MNKPPVQPFACSLWVGEIEPWMDEKIVRGFFIHCPEYRNIRDVRLIKDSGRQKLGYGFLDFDSVDAATSLVHRLRNQYLPGLNRRYRLKLSGRDSPADFTVVYVKNITDNTSESMVKGIFDREMLVKQVEIFFHREERMARVSFYEASDARKAIDQSGRFLDDVPIFVTPILEPFDQNLKDTDDSLVNAVLPDGHGGDKAVIFVKNIPEGTTKQDIDSHFYGCGPLKSIQVFEQRQEATVEFYYYASAVMAYNKLNGTHMHHNPIRIELKVAPTFPKSSIGSLSSSCTSMLMKSFVEGCLSSGVSHSDMLGAISNLDSQLGSVITSWLKSDRDLLNKIDQLSIESTDEYSATLELRDSLMYSTKTIY